MSRGREMKVAFYTMVLLVSTAYTPLMAEKNIVLSVPDACAAPGDSIVFSVDMVNPVFVNEIHFVLGLDLEKCTLFGAEFVRSSLCPLPCGLFEDSELGGIVYHCACFPAYGSVPGSDDPLFDARIAVSKSLDCGDRLFIDFLNVEVSSDEPFDSVEMRRGTIYVSRKGDTNSDCRVDVLDVVRTVRFVSGAQEPRLCERWAGDVNRDGSLTIVDIVQTVNLIIGKKPGSTDLFREFAHGTWMPISGDTVGSTGYGFIDSDWYAMDAVSSPETVFVTWEEGLVCPSKPGTMDGNGKIHLQSGNVGAVFEILSDTSCFATFYEHAGMCVHEIEKILVKKSNDATVHCF